MWLPAKKLLLAALWLGAIWIIWAPSSWFNGLIVGREGKTEHFGFASWYYVSVSRSGVYAEGIIVDGIVTNFHLPESTLLMLVSAFVGREKTLDLYGTAVRERYRFYSYGDAMFIS